MTKNKKFTVKGAVRATKKAIKKQGKAASKAVSKIPPNKNVKALGEKKLNAS